MTTTIVKAKDIDRYIADQDKLTTKQKFILSGALILSVAIIFGIVFAVVSI